MSKVILRKYGDATIFPFTLHEIDGINFKTDAVWVSGDVMLMKDEGAEATITVGFVDEGQGYSQALTDVNMEFARGKLYIADQGTKAWLDIDIYIETYGHANAQHPNIGIAMRGTEDAAKETTLTTMETTLVDEHDITQAKVDLVQNSIDNDVGGILRIQTSLVDQVIVPSGNNWVKVLVLVNDNFGTLFDPADIVDPSGSPVYNGVGVKFSDIDDDQVVMYKDNLSTPLDTVTLCQHAPQSNKPQILERDGHGLYYYWMNATATGNVLPVGQLKTLFGLFDILQTDAIYSGTSPFLIQDTEPSSHLHILFAISVATESGTNERLDDIITDIADHESARASMQTNIEGAGFDSSQHALKEIKNSIG